MDPSPTWMYSLFSRLSAGACISLFLLVIAGSSLLFLLTFESLMEHGWVISLVGVTIAATLGLSAARAMYTSTGKRPVVFTIFFFLVMGGAAAAGAFFCRDHSMRMILAVVAPLLVIADVYYSIRYLPRQPQGGAIS